jgi:OmpA-OmpF porin, OOP family
MIDAHRCSSKIAALLVACAFVCANAQVTPAQQDTKILRGQGLTADRVVQALSPSAIRSRSLVIGPSGVARVPRASASLLITFDTNSADLTLGAKRQLDVIAAAIKRTELASHAFTVEGHADPRGNPQENLTLSGQRATSVVSYLVSAHGIAPARLQAEGRGAREPLLPGRPAAPENRRVTFVTVH